MAAPPARTVSPASRLARSGRRSRPARHRRQAVALVDQGGEQPARASPAGPAHRRRLPAVGSARQRLDRGRPGRGRPRAAPPRPACERPGPDRAPPSGRGERAGGGQRGDPPLGRLRRRLEPRVERLPVAGRGAAQAVPPALARADEAAASRPSRTSGCLSRPSRITGSQRIDRRGRDQAEPARPAAKPASGAPAEEFGRDAPARQPRRTRRASAASGVTRAAVRPGVSSASRSSRAAIRRRPPPRCGR